MGRREASAAVVYVGFDDGPAEIPLIPDPGIYGHALPVRLAARSSIVRKFEWEGTYAPNDLAGVRLTAVVSSELPELKTADNAAKSDPITPVWMPR